MQMNNVDLLRAVPEAIWGVLLGSVLAFGATFVATRLQLRHDAEQRERDREMSLRRDIFLEAADAVAGTTDYFFKFANIDLPLSELTLTVAKPGWLNKLYTVASLETIEAFSEASLALGAAAFELLRQRFVLEGVKSKLDVVNEQVEAARREQQSVGEIAHELANQMPSPELFEKRKHFQQRWERSLDTFEVVIAEQRKLIDERLNLQRALIKEAVQLSATYQTKLRAALSQLRGELDFPIDFDKLELMNERLDSHLRPKFEEMLDAMGKDETTAF
jgi:hypothetical protein